MFFYTVLPWAEMKCDPFDLHSSVLVQAFGVILGKSKASSVGEPLTYLKMAIKPPLVGAADTFPIQDNTFIMQTKTV